MPATFDMFVVNASKSKARLPVYAKPIMTKAKTAIVSAMPVTLLAKLPVK